MNTIKPTRRIAPVLLVLLLIGTGTGLFTAYRAARPLPQPSVNLNMIASTPAEKISFDWSVSGSSIIGQADGKVLSTGPNVNAKHPTASVAKLLTVLTVLKKYPLRSGETGPTITLGDADVASYATYSANGGSVTRVQAGETITEYDMIQAMLLPSANNVADSLAIWAFGSLAAYRIEAQTYAQSLGMTNTSVGSDASGYSDTTTSTARDLYTLARAAYAEPVIRDVATRKTADIPVAGTIMTTNFALGQDGITGLKTGTGDMGVNNYVYSAEHTFDDGKTIAFVGVVLGSATEDGRFTQARSSLQAAYAHYRTVTVVKQGGRVGTMTTAWGSSTTVIAAKDLAVFGWAGDGVTPSFKAVTPHGYKKGATVGTMTAGDVSVPLVLANDIAQPSLMWRIAH